MLLRFPLCDFQVFSVGDSEEPPGVGDGFASTVRPCEVLFKLLRLCFHLLEMRDTHPPLAPKSQPDCRDPQASFLCLLENTAPGIWALSVIECHIELRVLSVYWPETSLSSCCVLLF